VVIVDVNVLIYAFRADTSLHKESLAWLTDRLADPFEQVVIPDLVWVGFIRITTSGRIFTEPSSINEVRMFIRDVVGCSTYRHVPGLAQGVKPLLTMMAESDARANLVTDAYIASLAHQLGAAVASFDRDFRRFDGVRIILPTHNLA